MDNIEEIIKDTLQMKLLYIEDDKYTRDLTVEVLSNFFSEIIVAVDGEDGYEKFKENNIDFIITDINTPKLNGLEMLKKIVDTNPYIPIFIISAYDKTEYLLESIKLSVDGYFMKPLDLDQLIEAFAKVTSRLKSKHIGDKKTVDLKGLLDCAENESIFLP